MSIKHGTVLALTVAIGASLLALEAQRRKPTVEMTLPVLRRLPPPTLADMLASVDLAAHVKILSSQPHIRKIPGGEERTTSFIAEILNPGRQRRPARSGDKIRIVQLGGIFEEPDRILHISEERNPLLAVGRSYLLMLAWLEDAGAYVVAYGPDATFEVQEGKVFPRGRSAAARELAGKDLERFS